MEKKYNPNILHDILQPRGDNDGAATGKFGIPEWPSHDESTVWPSHVP